MYVIYFASIIICIAVTIALIALFVFLATREKEIFAWIIPLLVASPYLINVIFAIVYSFPRTTVKSIAYAFYTFAIESATGIIFVVASLVLLIVSLLLHYFREKINSFVNSHCKTKI